MSTPRWQRPDTTGMTAAEAVAYLLARCPWGAAQTHTGLQKHLIEETHELIGALDDYAADPHERTAAEVEIELGDVLYQVLFHAALLDRQAAGGQALASMRDHEDLPGEALTPAAIRRVDARLTEKIIRRHPHVFDSTAPVDIDEVERRYEAIKTAERAAARQQAPSRDAAGQHDTGTEAAGEHAAGTEAAGEQAASLDATGQHAAAAARASFDSLPASVPALTRAQAVLGRIERLALDQPDTSGPDTSGPDTSGSDTMPGQAPTASGAEAELGRALFALVSQAHAQGLDAEAALRRVTSEVEDAAVEQARRQAVEGGDDTADARR
ncbi:MazG nucleotide pyrophosphohydrolase domain-containing protein [Brevibacterium luteolum]|uniref:MazG nucleotide pyrophosphohydrolase domain-containing protein n=1 Tax=Brevibacterium luteolum TaxID=199591 RepID=UPI003B67F045